MGVQHLLVSEVFGEECSVSCGSSVPLYKCKICSGGGELSYSHVFIVFHSFRVIFSKPLIVCILD